MKLVIFEHLYRLSDYRNVWAFLRSCFIVFRGIICLIENRIFASSVLINILKRKRKAGIRLVVSSISRGLAGTVKIRHSSLMCSIPNCSFQLRITEPRPCRFALFNRDNRVFSRCQRHLLACNRTNLTCVPCSGPCTIGNSMVHTILVNMLVQFVLLDKRIHFLRFNSWGVYVATLAS